MKDWFDYTHLVAQNTLRPKLYLSQRSWPKRFAGLDRKTLSVRSCCPFQVPSPESRKVPARLLWTMLSVNRDWPPSKPLHDPNAEPSDVLGFWGDRSEIESRRHNQTPSSLMPSKRHAGLDVKSQNITFWTTFPQDHRTTPWLCHLGETDLKRGREGTTKDDCEAVPAPKNKILIGLMLS